VASAADFDEDAFKAAFANTSGIKDDVEVEHTFTFTRTASYSIPKEITQQECIDLMADVYGAPHAAVSCNVYAMGTVSKRRLAEGNAAYAMDVTVRSSQQDLMKIVESNSGNTQGVISAIATKLDIPVELVAQTQAPQSAVEVEITIIGKSDTENIELEPKALAQGLAEKLGVDTHVRAASGGETPAPPQPVNGGDGEGAVADATPAPTLPSKELATAVPPTPAPSTPASTPAPTAASDPNVVTEPTPSGPPPPPSTTAPANQSTPAPDSEQDNLDVEDEDEDEESGATSMFGLSTSCVVALVVFVLLR